MSAKKHGSTPKWVSSDSDEAKPEVTNPSNLAPVDPHEPVEKRKDIRAARFETKLRRWALVGFVGAALLYFLWQSLS